MGESDQRRTAWQRIGGAGPAWARITVDPEISHGAAKFWFYLLNVCRNAKTGQCNPGQDTIARDIRCDLSSVKPWTSALVNRGYLRAEKVGKSHQLEYSFPHLEFGKTPIRGESRTLPNPVADCGNAKRREYPKCQTEPYIREPKPMKGVPREAAPAKNPERWQLKKDADAISQRISQLSAMTPTDDTRTTISKLKRQKAALVKAFDEFDALAVATPTPAKIARRPKKHAKPNEKPASIWEKSEAEREVMRRQLRAAVTPSGSDNGRTA